MSVGRVMALVAGIAFVLYIVLTWDLTAPRLDWGDTPEILGKSGHLSLHLEDSGKGLRQLRIDLIQGEQRQTLLSENYAGSGWPWQDRTPQRSVAVTLETAQMPMLEEGPFQVEITATDQPNLWLFSRTTSDTRDFRLDLSPPLVSILSGRHYLRQGGSELILYRSEPGLSSSGALLGNREFRGYPAMGAPDGTYVALVGAAYDQPLDSRLAVWAVDTAGNRSEARATAELLAVSFRRRRINISDSFIDSVAPEIVQQNPELKTGSSKLDTFLAINDKLRDANHEMIEQLSRESAGQFLWSEPFLQLSRSQVEAAFADQRTYYYDGKQVDQQTHLGFDLASTAQSPVEAANSGRVLWAGYLGIYGNCVILDHGLGLLSLYGHLSAIEVEKGDGIEQGQRLGLTGQTGLAGGDHLHFSTIVQGVQVNPLEWWDPEWVRLHVFERLKPESDQPGR